MDAYLFALVAAVLSVTTDRCLDVLQEPRIVHCLLLSRNVHCLPLPLALGPRHPPPPWAAKLSFLPACLPAPLSGSVALPRFFFAFM